jgi:hypothetical protein
MSNFTAELFDYCAGWTGMAGSSAKVQAFRAKLLAMQRASL